MNWKEEAQEKLKKYEAMRLATVNIPDELSRLELAAGNIQAARSDRPAVKSSGSRREDAIINNIVLRQELEQRLQQAQLWLKTTDRALTALTPEELQILQKLYIHPQPDAVVHLCRALGVEQSTFYRKRDKALRHFTIAFYGAS